VSNIALQIFHLGSKSANTTVQNVTKKEHISLYGSMLSASLIRWTRQTDSQ